MTEQQPPQSQPQQPQQPQQPRQLPPTRNLYVLAQLYDSTAADLLAALATKSISFTDERIKNKVKWLGDIAKTLSLVYQIETMRTMPKDGSLALPQEEVVVDPALQKALEHQFPGHQAGSGPGLGQFPGWKP